MTRITTSQKSFSSVGSTPPELLPAVKATDRSQRALFLLGILLFGAWIAWWVASYLNFVVVNGNAYWLPHLAGGQYMWVEVWPYLGLDFLHNYAAIHQLFQGINPYQFPLPEPMHFPYVYPPPMLLMFMWCAVFPPTYAIPVWNVLQVFIVLIAARQICMARQKLHLPGLPYLFCMALVLFSYPVVFEMERGNCHLLGLLMICLGVSLVNKKTRRADLVAGLFFAMAAWLKVYPGVVMFALLPLGRVRTALSMAVSGTVIGLITLPYALEWQRNVRAIEPTYPKPLHINNHASEHWHLIWQHAHVPTLANFPSVVAVLILLCPIIVYTTLWVYRGRARVNLAFPYLVWMTGLATFFPSISVDYNLLFIPVAALSVWNRKDPPIIHVLMGLFLLWWQPFRLGISPTTLYVFKLAALYAVGWSIAAKAKSGLWSEENIATVPIISGVPSA